jgi:hypothetical protein
MEFPVDLRFIWTISGASGPRGVPEMMENALKPQLLIPARSGVVEMPHTSALDFPPPSRLPWRRPSSAILVHTISY